MEHIVQFAIGIDDKAIQKRIEDNAYNDVVEKLTAQAEKNLPRKSSMTVGSINWRYLMEEELSSFAERHKDEIIEAAAEKLVESFKRTKAFKEHMADAMEQDDV